jgi:hypothetical protein
MELPDFNMFIKFIEPMATKVMNMVNMPILDDFRERSLSMYSLVLFVLLLRSF